MFRHNGRLEWLIGGKHFSQNEMFIEKTFLAFGIFRAWGAEIMLAAPNLTTTNDLDAKSALLVPQTVCLH